MIRKKHFQVNYKKPNIINILSNKFINKLFTKHFILIIHSTLMLNKVNNAKDYVKKVDQYILYNQKLYFLCI